MLLLYLGPEVIMPLASLLAAIGGALLMFWQRCVRGVRAVYRFILRKGPVEAAPAPEDEGAPRVS